MAEERTIIDAHPTKDLFIDMLVKDIDLIPAIADLVDNCVDGARLLRPNGDFTGLTVRIQVSPDRFRIVDNCGGIAVETARHYAFRFGRPGDMPSSSLVGRFGVGMKRALFKLGKKFVIVSATTTSRFVVEIDVDEWRAKEEWQFEFKELDEETVRGEEETGTDILVQPLHSSVAETFAQKNFLNRLASELSAKYSETLRRALAISLNGIPLQVRPLELLSSEDLIPAYQELSLEPEDGKKVTVKIYAGLAESNPRDAGWYVFCNGRAVLNADQSLTTGWGEDEEATIPKYHNQFARFRGYVFFDADDVKLLPWTTTKTGVDKESPIYRRVRMEMIQMMRPIIDFLNRLKEEREVLGDGSPSSEILSSAKPTHVKDITTPTVTFVAKPRPPRPSGPPMVHITYSKPKDRVERAKEFFEVSSNKEVGERTFDYWWKMECEEE